MSSFFKPEPRLNSKVNPKLKFASSRRSIKYDKVAAKDFLNHQIRFSCDDCSHFARQSESCTLGFSPDVHRLEAQTRSFYLTGSMAQCRFLEID